MIRRLHVTATFLSQAKSFVVVRTKRGFSGKNRELDISKR